MKIINFFSRLFIMSLITLALSIPAFCGEIHVTTEKAQCGDIINHYVINDVGERLQRITDLHAKAKQAIPLLLGEINNPHPSPVELENPINSYAPFRSPRYCGMVAAYLIEMILGLDNISLKAGINDPHFLLQGDPENFVFQLGYIVNKKSRKPIDQSKLPQIAKLYEAWWKDNADRNLESLRADWKKGKRPLTGSDYEWY
jgi:hypothetical protein